MFTERVLSLQAMLSNRTVEENDGSNPCIEISDIKYEIFTVGYEKASFLRHIPSINAQTTSCSHRMFGRGQYI